MESTPTLTIFSVNVHCNSLQHVLEGRALNEVTEPWGPVLNEPLTSYVTSESQFRPLQDQGVK